MLKDFIEFDPEMYRAVTHEEVKHFIPVGDCQHHNIPDCECGADEIAINGEIEIIVHRAFDKRELIEEVQYVDTVLEATQIRKEYMENCDRMFQEGKIDKKIYTFKRNAFDGSFQETFRTN